MVGLQVSLVLALAGAPHAGGGEVASEPSAGESPASSDPIVHSMPAGVADEDEVASEPVDPVGPLLVGIGGAATVVGAGLGSQSLSVEQVCDIRCAERMSPQIGFATSAAVSAALGAAIAGWGTARWIDARPPTRRTTTIAGVMLLSAAVVSAATGATLLGVARAQWRATSSVDFERAERIGRMANAGIAVSAVVPSLLTTGLVTMLVQRHRDRGLAHARR